METKISNSLFLYDYVTVLAMTEELLSLSFLDDKKRKEHQNNLTIYRKLQHFPA